MNNPTFTVSGKSIFYMKDIYKPKGAKWEINNGDKIYFNRQKFKKGKGGMEVRKRKNKHCVIFGIILGKKDENEYYLCYAN